MKNNDIFDFTGETAPFGDEIGIVNEMSNDCKCEKGYRRFCKECKKGTPESMKGFIDENAREEDEIYYCFWCDFIQSSGIDESIVSQQRDAAQAMKHNDYDMEDDGSDAMWELEEVGAFSDEGIMPGCHSRDWEYEMESREIAKEFEDMEFVGSLLKNAREKIQLSVEEMARRLKVPETFINDIESGQYINRHGDAYFISDIPVAASGPVSAVSADKHEVKREWWHGCSDLEITEKIADYLSYVIAPPVDKKHAPDDFEEGLIKNGFADSVQSILENNLMTMGLIQRAFKIGARAAYQIMDILFAAGVVKEFPQKDATTTLDLDEETIPL